MYVFMVLAWPYAICMNRHDLDVRKQGLDLALRTHGSGLALCMRDYGLDVRVHGSSLAICHMYE